MGSSPSNEKQAPPANAITPGGEAGNGPKVVDPRLPFDNYRQIFMLKNNWKAVKREFSEVAKENLISLFRLHPHYQKLWPANIAHIQSEDAMRSNDDFENAALTIFSVIDDVMRNIENVDAAIIVLNTTGKRHAEIPGFNEDYFKDMETSFLDSVRNYLGDRWKDTTESNFTNLFSFIREHLVNGMRS